MSRKKNSKKSLGNEKNHSQFYLVEKFRTNCIFNLIRNDYI